MIGESSGGQKLAGILPAPLCREQGGNNMRLAATASSLPSLVRLGLFKSANDAKSRFIHEHIRAAKAAAVSSAALPVELDGKSAATPGIPFPPTRVSEPLAVMMTETGLEEYRRRKRDGHRVGITRSRHTARYERRAPLLGDDRYRRSRLQQRNNKRPDLLPGARGRGDIELGGRRRRCTSHMIDTNEDDAHHSSDIVSQEQCKRRPSTSRFPCNDDANDDGYGGDKVNRNTTPTGDIGGTNPRTSSAAAHRRRRTSVKSVTGSRTKRRLRDNGHDEKPCTKATAAPSNHSSGRPACKTKTTVKMANICGGSHPHGGGSLQVRADGVVSISRFPRGDCGTYWLSHCGGEVGVEGDGASGHRHVASDWDREAGGMPRSRGCGGGTPPVVRRLVDPKSFTGTAATGHLPITVDLEKGVDVLLKDAPIAVKDHVGTQEVSWRLRLAERL